MAGKNEITLPPIYDSGMVLQRDRPIPVGGRAEPGAEVVVRFDSETIRTRSDERGDWKVHLAERAASEGPHRLRVESGGAAIMHENIRIGDVWLLSGQSNMARGFYTDEGQVVHEAEAFLSGLSDPNLRLLRIDTPASEEPGAGFEADWIPADYAEEPDALRAFSATGLYCGAILRRETGVPIGLIQAAHGGTRVENWVPEPVLRELRPELLDRPHSGKRRHLPSGQFNAKIYPLIPYPVRGVLFYQGEGNVGDAYYGLLFRRLIMEWRELWGDPDMPFIFAQLANWTDDGSYTPPLEGRARSAKAELREAQREALVLPSTAMVSLIDIMNSVPGDDRGGYVHPANKAEIGRRFALEALRLAYSREDLPAAPRPVTAYREANGAVRIRFADETDGLALAAGERPGFFTLAGAGEAFAEAKAEIVGPREIVVLNKTIREPARVRYAWADNPTLEPTGRPEGAANLVAASRPRLPVAPFALTVAEMPPAPSFHRGELLATEDFDNLGAWTLEAMDPSDVRCEAGELRIDVAPAHDGLTLWHRQVFEAPILIEYEARTIGEDGSNDLNHFIMASNPSGRDLFETSETRGGVFRNYHDLRLYYAGLGVAQNRYNRFRRYPRSGPPNLENGAGGADRELLLAPDESLRVRIAIETSGRIRLWKNERLIFDYRETEEFYDRGHFGFRSYNSRLGIRNFRVYRLKGMHLPEEPETD